MKMKSFLASYTRMSILVSLALFGIFYNTSKTKASNEKKNILTMSAITTSYRDKAWYAIQLGNIPVGLMSSSVHEAGSSFYSDYAAQFLSRVGYSPFLSILQGNLIATRENGITIDQKLISKNETTPFQTSENKWIEKKQNLMLMQDQNATLQGLFPISFSTLHTTSQIGSETNIFFYKTSSSAQAKILIPFIGTAVEPSKLNLNYGSDNFLEYGELPIEENINLSFKRITQNEYNNIIENPSESLIDFGWLSNMQSQKAQINNLISTLNECIAKSNDLNNFMIKSIPQSSYLLYRKLINVSHFCNSTKNLLSLKENSTFYEKMKILSNQMQKLLKEDKQELPVAIVNSPDIVVFYNDTVAFLWPKVTSLLIRNALEQISDNFNLEKNRKSLLGIQVNISSLQPKSVVRADIQLVDPSINFKIEKIKDGKINPKSINQLDNISNDNSIINGQFFAKNQDIPLGDFCEKNKGKIGLDLGDGPQIIINSGGIRGVWDINTRVYLARKFALKTSSLTSCRNVTFLTPETFIPRLTTEINYFKSNVISSDNEILLSNYTQKRLLVMPGKYKMITSSLVTGNVIATHEFNVDPSTFTVVTAKAK